MGEALELRALGGVRLRLLCHCRPHVRCHTEFLKAHIELRVQELAAIGTRVPKQVSTLRSSLGGFTDLWPDKIGDGPPCIQCGRQARALDPKVFHMYCAFCWQQHAEAVQWRAIKL